MTHLDLLNSGPYTMAQVRDLVATLDPQTLGRVLPALVADSITEHGYPSLPELLGVLNVVVAPLRELPKVRRPGESKPRGQVKSWFRQQLELLASGEVMEQPEGVNRRAFLCAIQNAKSANHPLVSRTLLDGRLVAFLNDGAVQVQPRPRGKRRVDGDPIPRQSGVSGTGGFR